MSPHVGAVVRDEDGDVADDGDPALVRLSAQLAPLLKEDELTEDVKIYLLGEYFPSGRKSLGLAIAQLAWPLRPITFVVVLQRRKESEIVEPGRLGRAELIELLAGWAPTALKGRLQDLALQRQQLAEVDVVSGQAGQLGEIVLGEQAVIDERLRRDQQRIPGEGRGAGVWRVAEAGRSER